MSKQSRRSARFKQALVAGASILAVALCALYAWLVVDLPTTENWRAGAMVPSTIIYDRQGRVLYEIMDPHAGHHQPVPLQDIPTRLQQATVATEDASFFSNPGVDPRAVIRAIWINLRGGQVLSGGSTITQQLARNLLLAPEERAQRTLVRKLREAILAYRMARSFGKDQILGLYLNHTYYGNMAYGVEAAANTYFGKPVRDLDLAECALIAGLPQAPSTYDPLANPQAASFRQRTVLNLMARAGYVAEEDAAAAAEEELSFAATPFPIRAPHFVMYVWDVLLREYGEEAVYRTGLRVHTTVDIDLQDRAREIARYHLHRLSFPEGKRPSHNVTNAAIVVLDPHTGELLVMMGSPDYFDSKIDGAVNVALMPRQPGSAIKPLTYAAAFQRDYTPATMLLDVRTAFPTREGNAYTPVNYDQAYHGPVLLREALASSLNIVAVKVLEHVGVSELVSLAQRLGMTTLRDPLRHGLALTLGGGEVRLLELTAAYATLANEGRFVEPRSILRVETSDGRVLQELLPQSDSQVIDQHVAFWISDILSDDTARIPAFGEGSVLALPRPAAVKTGTTTDWRDNWTVGYTPSLAVGVWVGNADNSPMIDVSGIDGAAPVWHQVMQESLKGTPTEHFVPPSGMVQVTVCAVSGHLPNAHCTRRRQEWFLAEQVPDQYCSIHRVLLVDKRTGAPATETTPSELADEQVVLCLPPEATEWADQTMTTADVPILIADPDSGRVSTWKALPPIVLTRPHDNATYSLAPDLPAVSQRIGLLAVCQDTHDIVRVDLYADNELLSSVDQPPYSTLWQLRAGEHRFRAEAVDTSGQRWSSAEVRITVLRP